MKIVRIIWPFLCLTTNLCATTLENALKECFPKIEQSEISAKLLLGGFSKDEKYIVNINNQKYVLRHKVNSKIEDAELYMLNRANELGIGPKIYYIAKDKSFVLMEFLEGGTITFDQVRTSEACISIANGIKSLHSSQAQEWIHYDSLALYEDSYNFLINNAGKKSEFDEAINMMRDAYTELNKLSIEKVNIHFDLHPRNIFIINGQAKFIDWGDVCYHDPFYDLALFSMFTAYTPELEELLLQTYLGREIEITDWQKFYQSKIIAYSMNAINFFKICFTSNPSVEMIDDHQSYEFLIKQFVDNFECSHSVYMNIANTLLREGRKLKRSL